MYFTHMLIMPFSYVLLLLYLYLLHHLVESKKKKKPGVFKSSYTIISWNVCHFSAYDTQKTQALQTLAKDTLDELLRYDADILVLQEFPEKKKVAMYFYEALKPLYEWESLGEHLFIWRRDRVQPIRHTTDVYARSIRTTSLVKEGLIRPTATIRFQLGQGTPLAVTSLHLHSEEKKALESFKLLLDAYPTAYISRFGRQGAAAYHMLVGDFNLNIHKHAALWSDGWMALGNRWTKTTSGARGVDWGLMDKSSLQDMDVSSRVLVMSHVKNSRMRVPGVSDHDPLLFTLTPYRSLATSGDAECLTN